MTIAAGIDVGASGVKAAIMDVEHAGEYGAAARPRILALCNDRIRRRLPAAVAREVFEAALGAAGLREADIGYIASTGDGEAVEFRRGHFYGMTAHARGGLLLAPEATTALDIGALHARAIQMDERGKVLGYRMTSQCASGSGQFLENIARYLGVTLEEVGPLSVSSKQPEMVSGICAVLAETDVINMVSRGIQTSDILKGIHLSMAGRLVKLLGVTKVSGLVILTGGLAADVGLVAAIQEELARAGSPLQVRADPNSMYAGALGAAIWGAYRHEKLAKPAVV